MDYNEYGEESCEFMEDYVEQIQSENIMGGAKTCSLNEMLQDIAGIKYNELNYNPSKEQVWAHVRAKEGLTIWILPK